LLGRENEQSKMPTILGITSDRVGVPYFLAATLWKSDAFQFPVFIESSPLKAKCTCANQKASQPKRKMILEETH
jgi:hypothetical protein